MRYETQYAMRHRLTIIFLLLSCFTAVAQDWATKDMKDWEEGPLVPGDFVKRSASDTSFTGKLDWYYSLKSEANKQGNLRYLSYRVNLKMDKLNSWYDPSSDICAPACFQNEFDIAEAVRRRMQNEIYGNPREANGITDYYIRRVRNRVDTYYQESRFGKDRDVVDKYAAELAEELDSLTVETQQAPVIGKKKWGVGFFAGYNAELFAAPSGSGIPMSNSLDWGLDIPAGRCSFIVSMCLGSGSRLREDGFYYDDRYDYEWAKGEKVSSGTMNIMGGYHILDKDWFSFMPFVGFGVGFFDQKMDPDHVQDRDHTSSELSGARVLAGLQFSYKFRRSLDLCCESLGESCVNFRIYGASTNFKQVGRTSSINFGVTLDWTGFRVKQTSSR